MPKASLTLPNGTVVQIEGSREEVQQLLQLYGGAGNIATQPPTKERRKPRGSQPGATAGTGGGATDVSAANLTEIVNLVKTCDEAEDIEHQILDRPSQVNRTLLPLYVVHEHLRNAFGLSSGDIAKITKDLGVPVSQPNASRTLSGTAKRYVVGDRVRKKGQQVRYKLSRRGLQYIQAVIGGTSDEKNTD